MLEPSLKLVNYSAGFDNEDIPFLWEGGLTDSSFQYNRFHILRRRTTQEQHFRREVNHFFFYLLIVLSSLDARISIFRGGEG